MLVGATHQLNVVAAGSSNAIVVVKMLRTSEGSGSKAPQPLIGGGLKSLERTGIAWAGNQRFIAWEGSRGFPPGVSAAFSLPGGTPSTDDRHWAVCSLNYFVTYSSSRAMREEESLFMKEK